MYINFLNDRKSLGYECLIDTQCGNRLVLITDSSVIFVKNVTLNGKRKIFVIIVGMIIIFSDVKSADAIGTSRPLQPRVVRIMSNQNTNRLIQPSKVKLDLLIKPKIIMPRMRHSTEVVSSSASKIVELRGGDMSPLTKALFRILLIWAMGQGHTPTEGFKPAINPGFGHQGQVQTAPRIAPKLQENPLNRNNAGQGTCTNKQNKAGNNELPDSSEYIYTLETNTAKKALKKVWKNLEAKKEVLEALGKIDKGELLPRNQKDFKGFKSLKEFKFSKTRMLMQPGKDNEPDKIVVICMRRDLEDLVRKLRNKYK